LCYLEVCYPLVIIGEPDFLEKNSPPYRQIGCDGTLKMPDTNAIPNHSDRYFHHLWLHPWLWMKLLAEVPARMADDRTTVEAARRPGAWETCSVDDQSVPDALSPRELSRVRARMPVPETFRRTVQNMGDPGWRSVEAQSPILNPQASYQSSFWLLGRGNGGRASPVRAVPRQRTASHVSTTGLSIQGRTPSSSLSSASGPAGTPVKAVSYPVNWLRVSEILIFR
jgi:hypothetical protein